MPESIAPIAGAIVQYRKVSVTNAAIHGDIAIGDRNVIEELFQEVAGGIALGLEALVVIIIAFAAVKAFVRMVPLLWSDDMLTQNRRAIWLRFATAIILALEFTLAADIIRSAIAPSWDAIGKLGAIAAIRIALNFFLARDIETLAERNKRGEGEPAGE